MERILSVETDGYEFAEFLYNYDSANGGEVTIRTYKPMESDIAGMKPTMPLNLYTIPFNQGTPASIEEIKTFDISLFTEQFQSNPGFDINNNIFTYHYGETDFRYIVYNGSHLAGIASIEANFMENQKTLQWVSAYGKSHDLTLPSSSLENNWELLNRICEKERIAEPLFKRAR